MKFIKKTTWKEILTQWKKDEATDPYWIEFYKEEGYKSWKSWRKKYINETKANKKEWSIYQIKPKEIPQINCAGHLKNPDLRKKSKWVQRSEQLGSYKFKDICKHNDFRNHEKVEEIKRNFPPHTQLIAFKNQNEMYLFEGHHRSIAITQMVDKDRTIDSKITIALAEF